MKCFQHWRRKDLILQKRGQTSTLVSRVKGTITSNNDILPNESLYHAWVAYHLAIIEHDTFGAWSFTWIALSSIFGTVKEIEEEECSTSHQ